MASLNTLTPLEQQRYREIEFYLFIENLLEKYNRSAIIYSIVESLAELFSCNVTILKTLIQSINNVSSTIIPDRAELGIMLYKKGVPVRKIRDIINMHPQTLYRHIEQYKKDPIEFLPKLDVEVREQIIQFLDRINEIIGWF